jgi:hypothetical protein
VNVVERLITSPYLVRAVVGVEGRIAALHPLLDSLDAPVFVVDKWLLSDLVGFRVTRGVLASADRKAPVELPSLLQRVHRLAILEGRNDFENLGALFRNAAAFGIDGVPSFARDGPMRGIPVTCPDSGSFRRRDPAGAGAGPLGSASRRRGAGTERGGAQAIR